MSTQELGLKILEEMAVARVCGEGTRYGHEERGEKKMVSTSCLRPQRYISFLFVSFQRLVSWSKSVRTKGLLPPLPSASVPKTNLLYRRGKATMQ